MTKQELCLQIMYTSIDNVRTFCRYSQTY